MSSIAMRRFTAGSSVRLNYLGQEWADRDANQASLVFKGIEVPGKNFLFDKTCRYIIGRFYNRVSLPNTATARIITHAPLRAKEASPFVSNKYPVVVCCFGQLIAVLRLTDMTGS